VESKYNEKKNTVDRRQKNRIMINI
jgi:hypothetical protein